MNIHTFNAVLIVWMLVGVIIHFLMFYITAPFGRHTSDKWGLSMNNKLAWAIMEFPSFAIMVYFLIVSIRASDSYTWILFSLWIVHYTHRTFIYPLRIRATPKKMPIFIVVSALFFNLLNAGFNGYYLGVLVDTEKYGIAWTQSVSFWLGLILFMIGFFINLKADDILINLRKPGETGYKIPRGFLFDYVSCPNLLGEIIEWGGFALLAYNLPALSFWLWTFANLVPRAKNHHDWYISNFKEYPRDRKIIFPFIY